MKVLYLSRAIFPSQVTHTLSIMRMCKAFSDSGHDVVLTGRAAKPMASSDVLASYGITSNVDLRLQRTPRLLDNRATRKIFIPSLLFALKARGVARAVRPDIAYSRLTLLELLAIPKNVPLIYEMHSPGPLGTGGIEGMLLRWLIQRHDRLRLVVTTNALKQSLQQTFPGVDIVVARLSAERPVSTSADTLARFRTEQLCGRQFKFHVGYTGFLDTIGLRGTDIICQAASRTPQAAFHVVGGEPEAVAYWRDYGARHNAHDNLFFYGHRNPAEMPLFLSCFDVVLAPLQFKTSASAPAGLGMSPLKIPQYMSYGKAIVASDLLPHREMLEPDETAILVDPSSPEAWSEAIRSLMDDPDLRARLGAAAQARYFSEYTPERRVETVLGGLIGG